MVVITAEAGADAVIASAGTRDIHAWRLGRVVPGAGRVILNGVN